MADRDPPPRGDRRTLKAGRFAFAALLTCCLIATAAQARGPVPGVARPADAVELSPTDDIQAAVEAHPPGTSFFLTAGTYRIQTVLPKKGDVFVGAAGAILNGSKLLENFERSDSNYVVHDLRIDPDTQVHGVCRKGFPRCDRPQDLYFDSQPLHAVAKLADVGPGAWYYDYPGRAVYFADDPSGHVVELSYRPFAFGGSAAKVTIRNLVIEKYAAADQQGAVGNHGEGSGWLIANNDVRWNHGYGVVVGAHAQVLSNNLQHNGEIGVGGGGGGVTGVLVKDNEIAFNVWNGTDCNWECGGAKWAKLTSLTVTGNAVHDNQGPGLWTDIDCSEIVYEDNDIERNLGAGISHEISGYAVIRRNLFKGNGADTFGWGWAGQVQIQNSTNTKVYRNTLVLDPAKGGNGIMIIQQNRGSSHMPRDNFVHDNDITMAGGTGAVAGWFADYKAKLFPDANNRFDHNHYHLGALAEGDDVWAPNKWVRFAKWQATGQDTTSTVDAEVGGAP